MAMFIRSTKPRQLINKITDFSINDENNDQDLVSYIMRDANSKDKINVTSVLPLSMLKEKVSRLGNSKQTTKNIEESSDKETINLNKKILKNKKKKLKFKKDFVEVIEIESFKIYNSKMTFMEWALNREVEETIACKKFKECFYKNCNIY